MASNVVAEEDMTKRHKPMKIPTLGRQEYDQLLLCEKYGHYVVKCCKKKCNEEANLTFTQDQELALMLAEKMSNLLMLNEEKVMVNLLTKGEDRVEINM